MIEDSPTGPARKGSALSAIGIGGLIAGTLDLIQASILFGIRIPRASVVTSKPANGDQVKTGQRMWPGTSFFYPVFSWSGKPVFVLQLRGPHFRI